ncbi:MAG: lysylphosphatidylglycerol synthase transmembrane domain-containing protein [Candidatus Omnitrophota bacterium]|nr:lysylphosphatidylglycerol synthase transmembrane domain-containing protein [Candidatus Omnitrophota bacterium]
MKIFKRFLSILLRVSISIILLIFLFKQVDKKSLLGIIRNANLGLLLAAFIIFFFIYILCLLRWEMLLKAVKIHLSLKRIIISFAAGIFFSLFLPSTIGGDLVRSIDLATHTKRPREVVATVLLDRLSGYIGLVVLALLGLLFGWRLIQDKSVIFAVAIITAILIVILLVLFNKFLYSKVNQLLHSPTAGKLRGAIKNLHQEIHYFRHHKKVIVNNLIFSILIQAIAPLTFFLIARSIGVKINIIYFFIFLPIISAITLLPISIGGLGLRDAATIFFFAKAGIGKDMAFAMSLLNFFFILICGALGGLIYVLTAHHQRIHHPSPHLHTRQ